MLKKEKTDIAGLYLDERIHCFRRKYLGLNNQGTRGAIFSTEYSFSEADALFLNEQIYAVLWHFSFWRLKRRNSLSAGETGKTSAQRNGGAAI